MSVTYKGFSDESVTSKLKVDVVISSDDEELYSEGEKFGWLKEEGHFRRALFKVKPGEKKHIVRRLFPYGHNTEMMQVGGNGKRRSLPGNVRATKRQHTGARRCKRPYFLPAKDGYVILDSGEESLG